MFFFGVANAGVWSLAFVEIFHHHRSCLVFIWTGEGGWSWHLDHCNFYSSHCEGLSPFRRIYEQLVYLYVF